MSAAVGPTERAKRIAKRVLDRSPSAVKSNRLYYEARRARGYKGVEIRPELTDRPDLLSRLDEDGIVVVPDYMPAKKVKQMLLAADVLIDRSQDGSLKDHTFTVQPDILFRIARADHLLPETQVFFNDETIRNLMRSYIHPEVASYRRELECRFGLSQVAQADLFHFDNWRPIAKAFLYLADVDEGNAPFRYLKGTHKLSSWRRRYELEYDIDGTSGRFGHFFPQEIRALRERYGWEEVVCTGRAGTVILADFRGLHRGTPLREGRRVLLNNTFDLMNPEAV